MASDEETRAAVALYRQLLDQWNETDAEGNAALVAEDGAVVGFDGSEMMGRIAVHNQLAAIFADHRQATYVAKVREVRPLGPGAVLLRAAVGMVPPGPDDLLPQNNAVQALVAVETPEGWRVAHFLNTPAAYHGPPEAAEELTEELRAVRAETLGSP